MSDPAATRSLQLLAFGALAAFAAAHWVELVHDPPLGDALLAALAACAGAAALAWLGSARLPRAAAWPLAVAIAAAALALGMLALGLRAELLVPGGWPELAAGIDQGLTGLADAEYPYAGQNPWARLAILLALPLGLALAAALAFWPGRRRGSAALALLVALYAIAVVVNPPPLTLVWGLALLVLIAAWLWLPGLGRRSARAAGAALAAAAVVGLGAAVVLNGEDPWVDWTKWRWPGDQPKVDFRWNHTYGPIDWPREGTALLRAESDDPHYWRTIALDRFDGFRWEVAATENLAPDATLELPEQVEGAGAGLPNPDWIEQVTFTVGALDSGLLVTPGAVQSVDGLDGTVPGVASTQLTAEPLGEGDEYTVTSYVPQPSAEQLRAAPEGYRTVLRSYTQLELPKRSPVAEAASGSALGESPAFSVPLYGSARSPRVDRKVSGSLYGEVQALARRLTAGAPTTYDAVTAIERHLRRTYAYDEAPPNRQVPLRAFLFADRTGYCQQFSGAMALMLRTLGIPSRVASGFSSGEREQGGGGFQISDRDAHSWVEVYFNGIGWVPFEPTPSAAPAGAQLSRLTAAREGRTGSGEVIPRRGLVIPTVAAPVLPEEDSGGGPWGLLLTALLVLSALAAFAALALGAALAIRALRYRSLAPDQVADAQARELRLALPRLGFPIPDGATLLELERRLGNRRGIAAYLAGLRESRFRPDRPPPDPKARRRMRSELAADRGLGARLRALLAIPPGAPR